MLHTTDGRVASTSPIRGAQQCPGAREESPIPSVVPGVQTVPLRLGGPISAEPVVRAAFDRQAVTPPLAPRPLTSVLAGTPGKPGRLGQPFQRLLVHASTGQLPGPVAWMSSFEIGSVSLVTACHSMFLLRLCVQPHQTRALATWQFLAIQEGHRPDPSLRSPATHFG